MRWKILEKKLRVLEAEYAWFKCFVWLKGYIYIYIRDDCGTRAKYIAQVSDRIHAHVDVLNGASLFRVKVCGARTKSCSLWARDRGYWQGKPRTEVVSVCVKFLAPLN